MDGKNNFIEHSTGTKMHLKVTFNPSCDTTSGILHSLLCVLW